MTRLMIALALGTSLAGVALGGCAAGMQGQKQEAAYDMNLGPETLAFQNGIYQTRGDAVPLREEELQSVGISEGYTLYRLKSGGGGPGVQQDVLYIKTANGSFQPLVRIQ